MKYKGAVIIALELALASRVAAGELNLNPHTIGEAQQQIDDVAREGREMTDKHLEDHRQDETNQKLNDIEDAIILNGDNHE